MHYYYGKILRTALFNHESHPVLLLHVYLGTFHVDSDVIQFLTHVDFGSVKVRDLSPINFSTV